MGKINILDSSIFNRIAAGEVVERPASIVKELVENSIDAGADFITINIENGGTTLISVSDNGCGIEKDDVEKAFLPHATSKIKTASDLDGILTLGFRGEALCSIAAVSQTILTSRTKDAFLAEFISFDHGGLALRGEIGAPFGTNVTVKNLFEKIPARKKFLQKAKTEEAEITSIISRLILANNTVGFKYTADGKTVFQASGKGLGDAVFAVYGMDTLNNLTEISLDGGDLKVFGYVSRLGYSKYNRSYQTLTVNGRYVKNADVSFAVYNCFKDYLMTRQYPMFILFVELPPDMVDVNVHPGKTEARFAAPARVISFIKEAVKKSLYGLNDGTDGALIAANGFDGSADGGKQGGAKGDFEITTIKTSIKRQELLSETGINATSGRTKGTINPAENQSGQNGEGGSGGGNYAVNYTAGNYADGNGLGKNYAGDNYAGGARLSGAVGDKFDNSFGGGGLSKIPLKKVSGGFFKVAEKSELSNMIFNDSHGTGEKIGQKYGRDGGCEGSGEVGTKYLGNLDNLDNLGNLDDTDGGQSLSKNPQSGHPVFQNNGGDLSFLSGFDDFRRAGKLFDTYILVERGNNVYIIDQHAAHERLIFDEMYKSAQQSAVAVQALLIPYFFSLDYKDAAIINDSLDELARCGIVIQNAAERLEQKERQKAEEPSTGQSDVDYLLCGVPLTACGFSESVFINGLIDMVRDGKISSARLSRDRIIMAACKAAVKGNDDLSDDEIESLLKKMSGLQVAMCPHGRPAVVTLPRSEIEKWFKRRF